MVRIGPLSKINFFIGQNNSGKSNIINFLNEHYFILFESTSASIRNQFNYSDYHGFDRGIQPNFSYSININTIESFIEEKILKDRNDLGFNRKKVEDIVKIFLSPIFKFGEQIWFDFEISAQGASPIILSNYDNWSDQIKKILSHTEWHNLWGFLTRYSGGDINNWIKDCLKKIIITPAKCKATIIPGIRKVEKDPTESQQFYSGYGLIEELSKLQHPTLEHQKKKELFNQINAFIKNVLENPDAEIEIPHDLDTILVHMNDKTLPLESLGMGIHEVVILAAGATVVTNQIVCIEEPEIHMHPLLQKKLITYLNEHTSNQYFITTHSTHIIDLPDSSIFHVTYNGKVSEVQYVEKTEERSQICQNLGYKPSDLMQSNVVIWVEGPSDRTYLNYWIRNKNPDFVEGVHYSIMFYGGKSVSNLSGLDLDEIEKNIEDLISLRALNRNAVIIFDSDRPSSNHKNVSDTKKRLRDEFDKGSGFAWMTRGREIENYLNYKNLIESIKGVHPRINFEFKESDYENHLAYENSRGIKTSANKVKVAKYYTETYAPDFDRLDLNERLNQLCEFIENSN